MICEVVYHANYSGQDEHQYGLILKCIPYISPRTYVRNDLVLAPQFPPEIWGKYEETMRGNVRTNNSMEGLFFF
jgi:hypothetical protein